MDSDFLRMAGNSGWNFDGERFLAIAPSVGVRAGRQVLFLRGFAVFKEM
jgi:hypothetical protein